MVYVSLIARMENGLIHFEGDSDAIIVKGLVSLLIKVLSEQSKAATGQVRNVLNDIQKATNSAVIASSNCNKRKPAISCNCVKQYRLVFHLYYKNENTCICLWVSVRMTYNSSQTTKGINVKFAHVIRTAISRLTVLFSTVSTFNVIIDKPAQRRAEGRNPLCVT